MLKITEETMEAVPTVLGYVKRKGLRCGLCGDEVPLKMIMQVPLTKEAPIWITICPACRNSVRSLLCFVDTHKSLEMAGACLEKQLEKVEGLLDELKEDA